MTLRILGLIFTFLGSVSLALGLFVSKKKAIELGVSRWSGKEDEDNLKLPAVKDRLKQRKYGIIGATLLTVGFIIQIISEIK